MQNDLHDIVFNKIGLFVSDTEWSHPYVSQDTNELIYVTNGTVDICCDGTKYSLKRGDIVLLEHNRNHYGTKTSYGTTSFFWLHFFHDDPRSLGIPYVLRDFNEIPLFRELMHYHIQPTRDQFLLDCICLHIIAKMLHKNQPRVHSKLASEIFEWTRINATGSLSVSDIAHHFSITHEHASRIIKQNYGMSLKQLIVHFLTQTADSLLCNSNLSIKEISAELDFSDYESFIKFYKYNKGCTPSQYRRQYVNIHMNKK